MMPEVALKVIEDIPTPIKTDAGTVSSALLLDSETVSPPAGAFLVSVTVQVLAAEDPRLVGLQLTADSAADETRLRVAVRETPLRVAVTIAL